MPLDRGRPSTLDATKNIETCSSEWLVVPPDSYRKCKVLLFHRPEELRMREAVADQYSVELVRVFLVV